MLNTAFSDVIYIIANLSQTPLFTSFKAIVIVHFIFMIAVSLSYD